MTPSDSRPPHPRPEARDELIRRATLADGSPPFSDGALVALAGGTRELLWLGPAAALREAGEAEFVVDPDARAAGHGTLMLEHLLTAGDTLFWAHGDHPAARALARSHGLDAARELLHLELRRLSRPPAAYSSRLSRPPAAVSKPGHDPVSIRRWSAYSTSDGDAWVALNARAFATHPEQGAVTRADLDVLTSEPWFDPDDLLLLWDGPDLIGYCWLKVEGGEGEFYVVGVSPDHQGEGLGRQLVEAGLARLESRGIGTAHLYVEGDNTPALALYRSFGFTQQSIDVQYRRVE
ncbi:mycothiol synthase [soil metagenome]